MKKLYALRHAKTERHHTNDHERALTERGVNDCHVIGQYIKESKMTPDHVYCSSATRTRQTHDYVSNYFISSSEVHYTNSLYVVSGGDIIKVLSQVPEQYESIMIVGHNPGVSELLHILPKTTERHLAPSMPTASLAIYDLMIPNWQSIEPYCAKLVDLITPKMLSANE